MPPLEAWAKVLVSEEFLETDHNKRGCSGCHGGDEAPQTMATAHVGVVADPAADPERNCDACHPGRKGAAHQMSLHGTLAGYKETIRLRSGQAVLSPELEDMFTQRCADCHTTCGQCHLSRPRSVGGGLNAGHMFYRRPSMTLNCTACHGSRIGEEFRGAHAGLSSDVHYNRGMQCTSCHSAYEVHTSQPQSLHRYDEDLGVKCETCHAPDDQNEHHRIHAGRLSCQVCHSQPYKNCYSCHVGRSASGLDQPSELDFKIGRNPLKDPDRPYDYVLLRHVPITPDSYEEWAPGQMADFAALPTWKYTTPHNIQKNTPQTADCTTSCHNNTAVFLTREDLQRLPPEEQAANEGVVVDKIP